LQTLQDNDTGLTADARSAVGHAIEVMYAGLGIGLAIQLLKKVADEKAGASLQNIFNGLVGHYESYPWGILYVLLFMGSITIFLSGNSFWSPLFKKRFVVPCLDFLTHASAFSAGIAPIALLLDEQYVQPVLTFFIFGSAAIFTAVISTTFSKGVEAVFGPERSWPPLSAIPSARAWTVACPIVGIALFYGTVHLMNHYGLGQH
jgi:hypothetical protein